MKFFNNFLNKRRQNKIRKKIAKLQEQAMLYQRNGNLRAMASLTKQITELEQGLRLGKNFSLLGKGNNNG